MTSTSAPASMTRAALLCFTPPSTSMRISRPVRSIIFRISGIFATQSSRSVCPPNPGFTVITSTRSHSGSSGSSALTGVSGLMLTPARTPSAWMASSVSAQLSSASTCTVIRSAPALAYASMYCIGRDSIRCVSRNRFVCLRIARTKSGPKLMFGAKCPSMLSRCSQ